MSDTKSKLLKALLSDELATQLPPMDGEEAKATAETLINVYEKFSCTETFHPGMLVKWKPGLRNKKKPRYDEPCVVIEVLDKPVFGNTDESGSSYFREPLNLIAGFLDDDEDFVAFHFDSRRFMPF